MKHEGMGLMNELISAHLSRQLKTKIGYVTSYDPANYAVKVRLEPESTANEKGQSGKAVETNWVPLMRTFGGNGWGMVAPPKADPNPPYGDMVVILWPDGGHGVAINGFFNAVEQPLRHGTTFPSPDQVPTSGTSPKWGEFLLYHATGAFIAFTNDGSVTVGSDHANQGYIKWNADGSISVQGKNAGGLQIANTSPVGPPGTSVEDDAVVTRADLAKFYADLMVKVAAGCQSGSGGDISGITVVGSTTVTATD